MQNINDVIEVVNSRNLKDRIVSVLKRFKDFVPDKGYSTVYCVEDDRFFQYKSDVSQPDRPATLTYIYYCNHHFITFEYYPDGKIFYGCNFGSGSLWCIRVSTMQLLTVVDRSVFDVSD